MQSSARSHIYEELSKIEDTYNELDELRDEVSETCDIIPESFAERLELWEEYNNRLDEFVYSFEEIKDSATSLEELIEDIEDFISVSKIKDTVKVAAKRKLRAQGIQ